MPTVEKSHSKVSPTLQEPTFDSVDESSAYFDEVHNTTKKELGERPAEEDTLGNSFYTAKSWASNLGELAKDCGKFVLDCVKDPEEIRDKVGSALETAGEKGKHIFDDVLTKLNVSPEYIQEHGAELATLPLMAIGSSMTLVAGIVGDIATAKSPDEIIASFETRWDKEVQNIANVVPAFEDILGSVGSTTEFAKNLLKQVGTTYGFNEIWEGVKEADFDRIGHGLRKFAVEASGWKDLERAFEAFQRGDFVGFATSTFWGVASIGATAAAFFTFGGSSLIAGALKGFAKEGLEAATKESVEILAKDVSEKIIKDVAENCRDALMAKAPKELANKTSEELLEHVFKEGGEAIYKESHEKFIASLSDKSVLKEFKLPKDVLRRLEHNQLNVRTQEKLADLFKETCRENSEKWSLKTIDDLNLKEILPSVTEKHVLEQIESVATLPRQELQNYFKNSLIETGTDPKIAAGFAKKYCKKAQHALKSGKVDDDLIDLYSDTIHKEFTGSIRNGFDSALDNGMPKLLDDLKVHKNLRDDLSEQWTKAGKEGFEEGLTPIKKLIREGVENAFKKFRRDDEDDDGPLAAAKIEDNRVIIEDDFSREKKTAPWQMLDHSLILLGKKLLQSDDEDPTARAKAEAAAKNRKEHLEKLYADTGKTTSKNDKNEELDRETVLTSLKHKESDVSSATHHDFEEFLKKEGISDK
jgi:hypothetical protein